MYGRLFGTLFLHHIQKSYRTIIPSLQALFPEKSDKHINWLYKGSVSFLGQFLLHTMFVTPRLSNKFSKKKTKFKNLEVIEAALDQGKGLIIPSLHVGNFIEGFLASLVIQDVNHTVACVASPNNMMLFDEILARPVFCTHAIGIDTQKFSNVKEVLIGHLKKNHIVAIMFDYTKETQFRVPFLHGKFPYLQHTPQSIASIHRATGAPIIPAINHPVGELGKSLVEFLDNKSIMETSHRYWDAPKKTLYGMISTQINKTLNPYLRIYAHFWEEIMNFSRFRIADHIKFEPGVKLSEFMNKIKTKMLSIIEYSFEPNRKDEDIILIITNEFDTILNSLEKPDELLRSHKTKIDLSRLDGVSELLKLCMVASKELKLKNELRTAALIKDLAEKIKNIDS
jgi:lauroyl/myristoyl acyltransferase